MKKTVIITAGGVGKRMGANVPKQFLLLKGTPILMRTMQLFYDYDNAFELIVSLPKLQFEEWQNLCEKHKFTIQHKVVEGGKERYHSIKNALGEANGELIFVHDAVRPLVSRETIQNVVQAAMKFGAAVPVMPVKESLRKGKLERSEHVNRNDFFTVQTPQAFHKQVLIKAYQMPYDDSINDDASLVEKAGYEICLVEGNDENLKITTPIDMKIAEVLMA